MKVSIKILATTLMLCLLGLSAKAIIVFQDNFNYTPGTTLTNSLWVAGTGNTLPTTGILVSSTNSITIGYNGTGSAQPRAYFTNGLAQYLDTNTIWIGGHGAYYSNNVAGGTGTNAYYFPSNAPVAAIYYSFTITMNGNTDTNGTYFAYLTDTNFDYGARLYTTNGPGQSGYQLGVQDAGTFLTTNLNGPILLNPQVLNAGQAYQVVVRYILNNGLVTLWINPTAETVPVIANGTGGNATVGYSQTCIANASTPTIGGGTPGTSYCAIGFRNTTGLGEITIGNLVVGTQFADVVPSSAGMNPPYVASQPQDDPVGYIGAPNATFTAVMGGDPITYEQWYFDTNTLLSDQSGPGAFIGSSSNVLVLTNLVTGQQGTYDLVVSNALGTNVSRYAQLTVYNTTMGPSITSQPVGSTNTVGDVVTFNVNVTAIPPAAYQWCFVSNSFVPPRTNALAGSNITGTNTATLTISQVTTNQAGYYCCIITNVVGVTNSAQAQLVVGQPLYTNISGLYGTVNQSTFIPTNPVTLYTIQGIVTTYTNMTTSGNTEFCMQDNTAGIWVYWQAAPASTNLPPVGAKVTVTGPLTNFDGLFEIQPVFGNKQEPVVTNALNQPLPTPIQLPTDPNIVNNTALMFSMEGTYMVASNVTLSAAPTFVALVNEPITVNASNVYSSGSLFNSFGYTNEPGETGDLFVNEYSTIPNSVQPSGPVTIYGNLGYFLRGGAVTPAGFEFTPSAINEIITYTKLTNYLSNLTRLGDQPTNEFPQSVLRPGETLVTYLSIADPEGGTVTITPIAGLPAGASWSNITSPALIATATFTFTPTANDAGTNYFIQMAAISTSGNQFTNTFTVYVPNSIEQQIYISEIFANPTTNTTSRAYNPLKRQNGDFGVESSAAIPVDDTYVEIADIGPVSTNVTGWWLGNSTTLLDEMAQGNTMGDFNAGSAYVVYGGPATGDNSYPSILGGYTLSGSVEPINSGQSLGLSTSGGIVTLYNSSTNLIDRVVYTASVTNCSFSRFPTLGGPWVPQAYVSTNWVTAGAQYDGSTFASPAKLPVAVTGVSITEPGRTNVVLKFNATTPQAYTIWNSSSVFGPFNVMYGYGPLTYPAVNAFTNPASGSVQYYFMTTQ